MPFSWTSSFSLHLCSHRLLHSTFPVLENGMWLTDGWRSLELGVESPVRQAACFEAVRDGRRLCLWGTFGSSRLPKRGFCGEAAQGGTCSRLQGFFLPAPGQPLSLDGGRGCLDILVYSQNSSSVTLALPRCPCIFRVEPLCCQLWIVHAVEFFREELGSRMRTLLPEGPGILLLAGSWQILTVGASGREV